MGLNNKEKTSRSPQPIEVVIVPRDKERGHVLVLMLAVICLFIALYFTATSENAQPNKTSSDEQRMQASTQIIHYSSLVEAAVRRAVEKGASVEDLIFATPDKFEENCTGDNESLCVFHEAGGEMDVSGYDFKAGEWYYNANYEVESFEKSVQNDPQGNDLMLFYTGVSSSMCDFINQRLLHNAHLSVKQDLDVATPSMAYAGYEVPSEMEILRIAGADKTPRMGCFVDNGGKPGAENIYFHVLYAR